MLHPPQIYHPIKMNQSAAYFKDNKIHTCKKILMKYDKQTVAVAYPLERTGWKNPFSHQNMNKSSETMSINAHTFKQRPLLHSGMARKPLERYNPNSYRSRLPVATVVMPYKNSSQIVIGDRTTHNKTHFKTGN